MAASQEQGSSVQNEVRSLQSSARALQSSVRLSGIRDSIEDLNTGLGGVEQRISSLRTRGYVFGKSLEARAAALREQWDGLRPSIEARIVQETASLQQALPPIERQLQELAVQAADEAFAEPRIARLKAAIEIAKDKVSAAESSLRGSYDALLAESNRIGAELNRVDWMLKELAESSFPVLPVEAGIGAVRASWVRGEKESGEDPRGVLFLTDQRLVFEQKEEVATKKVLFITTERQKVQQVLVEAPVGHVETVTARDQGLLGHEDHIFVELSPEAPIRHAHFHIDGQDCKEWAGLILRAKSGDLDQDRAVAIDREVLDRAKSAPTRCPTCGAELGAIVRGMDQIRCEYCGSIVRF